MSVILIKRAIQIKSGAKFQPPFQPLEIVKGYNYLGFKHKLFHNSLLVVEPRKEQVQNQGEISGTF